MARVTVEDCLEHVENQFELTAIASKRARQLTRGATAHQPWENHKSTVMALREIADGYIGKEVLEEIDLPPVSYVPAAAQPLDDDAEVEEEGEGVKTAEPDEEE